MKRSGCRVWFVLLALLGASFLASGRCTAAPSDSLPVTPVAREWEFTDLDGMRRKLDWKARDQSCAIVFFFDPQSSSSLLGLNYFDALFKRGRDFGLTVIGVEAKGRPAAEVRALLKGYTSVYKTLAFPVTADQEFAAAKNFGGQRAPTALIFGKSGEQIALRTGFDFRIAVEITRIVEQLLRRGEGFFSPALRDMGLSEPRERQLSARAEAPEGDGRVGTRVLGSGDRLPAFEFTDMAGRAGRWAWPGTAANRVAFFWSGASPNAAADLAFYQELRTRAAGEPLEIVAVEATGIGPDVLNEILEDFKRKFPAPAFPVIADPQARLVGLFGAGDPLPQTFLLGRQGEVLYRADGLDPLVKRALEEKITRSVRLDGLGLPQAVNRASGGAAPGTDALEAPSISRRLERDEALRFNLSQGDYYFSNGQHERAVLFYQRYLELEPMSLHALVRLAQIHDLIRDPAKARDYWERVLAISPDHAEGRARLIELRRVDAR